MFITGGHPLWVDRYAQAVPKSPAERRAWQAALIPVAAKRIARRVPDTPRMVELSAATSGYLDLLAITLR